MTKSIHLVIRWSSELGSANMGKCTNATGFTITDDAPDSFLILTLDIPDEHLAADDADVLADGKAEEDKEDEQDEDEWYENE
jgi:hypothetical protein